MKYKVKQIEGGGACPSQWFGVLEDGGDLYIRYRWGSLSVSINNSRVYRGSVGEDMDGYMTSDEMKNHLKDLLIFP